MPIKLNKEEARKLIEWLDQNDQTLKSVFPKLDKLTFELPRMRSKERELINIVVGRVEHQP